MRRDRKRIKIMAAAMLVAGAALTHMTAESRAENLQPEIAKKILRFHIRANSDEELDQELKLEVRDAIGNLLGEKLNGVSNLEESKAVVTENMPQIIEKAEEVIAAEGYAYTVDACLTTTSFPEKTYGDYTFPAGEYEALEVEIGEGAGHNWWCVLYPNMCFRGSVYEVVEEDAGEELRQVLTKEEYDAVFTDGNYEVRFWLADWFEKLMNAEN